MLGADGVRCVSQGVLAALLVAGEARLWHVLVLQAVAGAAEAFFTPASTGLTPQLVAQERLQEGNALRLISEPATDVVGPAISAASLLLLRVGPHDRLPVEPLLRDLGGGWNEFRGRRWLVIANAEAASTNMLVPAPMLVLGPAVAARTSVPVTAHRIRLVIARLVPSQVAGES
jgi:hypothetical protein